MCSGNWSGKWSPKAKICRSIIILTFWLNVPLLRTVVPWLTSWRSSRIGARNYRYALPLSQVSFQATFGQDRIMTVPPRSVGARPRRLDRFQKLWRSWTDCSALDYPVEQVSFVKQPKPACSCYTRTCRMPSLFSSNRNWRLWKPELGVKYPRNSMKSSGVIVSKIMTWSLSNFGAKFLLKSI